MRIQPFGAQMAVRHYPQRDDDPLCCCEYRNRRGERSHLLACCCACDELDQAADRLFSGHSVGRDRLDEILKELDDRCRVPWRGGAWRVGVMGALPFVLLPPPLLLGAISARALGVCGLALLPTLLYCHRRALRLRRRTQFLFAWMLASIVFEVGVYALAVAPRQPRAHTHAFVVPLGLSLLLLARLRAADTTHARGAADEGAAVARGARCAVCDELVPRYDHYCAWTDTAVGAANHRAYLGFVASLLVAAVVVASHFAQHAAAAGLTWRRALLNNESSTLLSCAAYAYVIAAAVGSLLAHQLSLVCRGLTAYEARHRERLERLQGDASAQRRRAGAARHVLDFLAQTVPVWDRAGGAAGQPGVKRPP